MFFGVKTYNYFPQKHTGAAALERREEQRSTRVRRSPIHAQKITKYPHYHSEKL